MRDRLRIIECPEEVSDAIGGWATKTTGQAYGNGYPLSILATWMRDIESPKKTNNQLPALHSMSWLWAVDHGPWILAHPT